MLSGTEVSIDRDRPYKTNARLKAPRSTQVSSILVFTALSATVVGPLSALARNYEADKMTVTTNPEDKSKTESAPFYNALSSIKEAQGKH